MSRIAVPFTVRVTDHSKGPDDFVALPKNISDKITEIVFEDHVRRVDKLTLTIDNFHFEISDSALFRKKTGIEVTWGYPGMPARPRRCVVEAMKGWTTVQVEALGELVKMNDKAKTRVFENKTRSQVVAEIADEHGYDSIIEDTEVVYPLIPQTGLTDAQFLARLARKEKFEFFFRIGGSSPSKKSKVKTKSKNPANASAKTLHFHSRDFHQPPLKEVIWYSSPTGEIISGSFDNDTKNKAGSITAKARDPKTKKDIKQEGSNDKTTGTPALGGERELNVDKVTGATSLATSSRGSGIAVVVPSSATTDKEAKRQADAAYMKAQKSAFKLNLVLVGDPAITAGVLIRVLGIGRRLSGNYYIEKAVHRINAQSYQTAIECVRDAHGGYGDQKGEEPKQVNDKKPDGDPKKLQERSMGVDERTGAKGTVVWEPKGG
jgi:uncharacterized protein